MILYSILMLIGACAAFFAAGWRASNYKHRLERQALRRMIDTARRTGEEIAAFGNQVRGVRVAAGAAVERGKLEVVKSLVTPHPTDGTSGGKTMGGGKAP